MAATATMTDWISVKDRLPEYEVPVLAAILDTITMNYFQIVSLYWKSHIWNAVSRDQVVTHWIPLPEPPRA